jgi:hypothetical protein
MPNAGTQPVRLISRVRNLDFDQARRMANMAVRYARANAPKLNGTGAKRITPVYGKGYFGLTWQDSYMWFQEMGIKAFTMNSLQGKTIPMWIDDPIGTERAKNPKAETRVTKSGKTQVLIFRKAGTKGATKRVKTGGQWTEIANSNYPGSPGRIALREAAKPFTTPGRVGGRIAANNVGVRWRHPGLSPRHFLLHGIQQAAQRHHVVLNSVVAIDKYGHESSL